MVEAARRGNTTTVSVSQGLVWVGLFAVALIAVYWQTAWSIVAIWLRSGTFAHGFLILPIVLWLVWERRDRLVGLAVQPNYRVLLLIMPAGFLWLLASLVDVLVVQQLAMVSLLVLGIWSIIGNAMARELAFPLLFLFFAVPVGEGLIPPMMEFTASSTVWLIEQTGIPVYREGLYFTLPSGNWSIVEACSGVRYLIASVTLGVLYAYLTFRSVWRRALFILVSIVVPVLANSLRAYIIVLLGHISDMKVATGADHLVYGWVFFGIVIMLMFWVGSFFGEKPRPSCNRAVDISRAELDSGGRAAGWFLILPPLVFAAIWPLLVVAQGTLMVATPDRDLRLPPELGPWERIEGATLGWDLREAGVTSLREVYRNSDGRQVFVALDHAVEKSRGVEVVGSLNYLLAEDSPLRFIQSGNVVVEVGDYAWHPRESRLLGAAPGDQLVWAFYRIGGTYTGNDYTAKLYEVAGSLGFREPGAARIIVSTPVPGSGTDARTGLQGFLESALPAIDSSLSLVGETW